MGVIRKLHIMLLENFDNNQISNGRNIFIP